MENLISHLEGPNKHTINLIKLDSGEVVNSTSKWLSDRWFLREVNFAKDLNCIEISPFKSKKDSSPGEIIKVSNSYFLVQTNDFVIKVKEWYGNISKGMILS